MPLPNQVYPGPAGDDRAHERDERIGVKSYHDAATYWYELVKTLGSGQPTLRKS